MGHGSCVHGEEGSGRAVGKGYVCKIPSSASTAATDHVLFPTIRPPKAVAAATAAAAAAAESEGVAVELIDVWG